MGTTDGYKYHDALRCCDICGVQYHKSELTRIGPLRWACKDDADGLTAEQIARHNASVRPLIVRPVTNPKAPSQTPTYQQDEADILNLILKYAPQQVFLAESGDFGANQDSVTGLDSGRTAGWMGFYLGNLVIENRRPHRWIEDARAKLLSLADNILLHQFGYPGSFPGDAIAAAIDSTMVPHGGVVYADPAGYFSGVRLSFDVHGTSVCLMTLLRAYQASGLTKYLDGARRAGTFLRRAQCVGLYAILYSQTNTSGSRLQPGPFPATVIYDMDDHQPGALALYTYTPGGIIAAWALQELLTVDGDKVYGDVIPPTDFAVRTDALLSVAIKACVDWWTNGQLDANTNAVVAGFGSATPRDSYTTPTFPSGVQSGWVSPTVGTETFDWSLGTRSLWRIGGYTAKVAEVYSWLRAGASNAANQVPSTWTTQQIQKSIRGIYDPGLCLATRITATASDFAGSGYDWRTEGLLAPIQSSRDSGSLGDAKTTLSVRLPRRWRMRMNTAGQPLTATGSVGTVETAQYFADLDTRDDPRLLTQTGLSMQTSSGLRRSNWTSGLVNGHYLDLQGAGIIGDVYRYPPQRFPLAQG